MTVIRNNSISGINSITAQSGALNFYDSTGNTLSIGADVTGGVTVATGATISGSTNTIVASTNGSERVRINSSGNIGIGTIPQSWSGFRSLQLGGTTSIWSVEGGQAGSSFYSNNIYYDGSNRRYLTNNSASEYIQDASTGNHIFYEASSGTAGNTLSGYTEIARFTSDGLKVPSGSGIDFSATADGSGTMSSELLDDYEEGTWTPTINASLTGGVRAGFYTKVGNKVTAWAIVQWTANSGAGGGIGIGGLPYSSTSESYFRGPGSVGYTSGVDLGASIAQLVVHLNPSTTNISLHTLADNAAASAIGAQNCSASGEIQVTMTYMV